MAHMVETMAYAGETPWHGLGVKVDQFENVDDMLVQAGLDWTVKKVPVYVKHPSTGDLIVADSREMALQRSTDGKVLSHVGKRYVPTQNREALMFFQKFAEKGHVSLETAGSLDDGRYIWGLAKLKSSFMLSSVDKVEGYLLLAAPHKMGYAIQAKVTGVRVVCNNTLSMALGEGRAAFSMPHLSAFDQAAYARAEEALGLSEEKMSQFERNAKILTNIKLGADDTVRLLAKIFQTNDPVEDVVSGKVKQGRKLSAIMEAITAAPGHDLETADGTAWGVLNGLTFLNSHVTGRDADSRMMSTWFGSNASANDKVLGELLKLAD